MTKELKDPAFHQRLQELIGNEPPFSWAARMGISKGAFSRIWNQGTIPGPVLLRRIQDRTGVSLDWLVSGRGPNGISRHCLPASQAEKEYVTVPLNTHHASAGGTPTVYNEPVVDALAFRRDWLQQTFHTPAEHLLLMVVEGESMNPVLHSGDLVLVDTQEAGTVPRDGIYVLWLDSTLLVKRLQRLPGDHIRVSSENPAYADFTITRRELTEDNTVVGRIIWFGRTL